MQSIDENTKRNELRVFMFLTVFLWPILAMAAVAGFGLIVWIYQLFMGPPSG
jgi:nitrate reductase NapE